MGYIDRKSGLNLSNNLVLHHTHQDIDANYDMAASLVAAHREKPQQTLEHFPMETLNLNAQQVRRGSRSQQGRRHCQRKRTHISYKRSICIPTRARP